ncbi:SusC/RagA family TonB-linked outer membrane protein [Chitinophaga sp. XS-30]|uniref:SusC/RagA family TonB-linked outer membrane protein n=1 Tax=Chitinophaga sp. XS-30 TaxID=2604421 RepID=UPI0011DD5ECF|nr:SusC/RagA family TonB-linked outer membrane protein [Chitinophaga sp. XS-30]QEH39445.1 SusC/RagA family TonB-linked outer membrane protein [Chitinophaga sp. XS-30]
MAIFRGGQLKNKFSKWAQNVHPFSLQFDLILDSEPVIFCISTKRLQLMRQCYRTTIFSWYSRLTVLLLLPFTSTSARAVQDSASITINVKNASIEEVFRSIERQTNFSFVYNTQLLPPSEKISIHVQKASLGQAMDMILEGRKLKWSMEGKAIVISVLPKDNGSRPMPKEIPAARLADTIPKITVSGIVVDAKGKPLPGTTVLEKGANQGTSTNAEGRFILTNVASNATLSISSIGYEGKQIKLNGRSVIDITLNEVVTELENVEVVSTGYQDIPKERATGSFVQLDNELVNRTVSTNILDRIYNVTSSLKFEPRPGSPNANGSNISIRGFSTINANMKPLIVIDGFPYEEDGNSTNILLNNLNPNDVQSITILRDAAAASIWGARSGNGVIVITTKKGRFNKKAKVQLNANVNITEKPNLGYLPIISSRDAIEFERARFATGVFNDYDDLYPSLNYFPVVSPAVEIMLAERRGELTKTEADAQLNALSNRDVRDDIDKYLLRTSVNQQFNVNINGGTGNYNYYGSIGYDKNLSNELGNGNSRFTFRLDNTFKPIKNLEVNGYIVYTQSERQSSNVTYQNFLATGTLPAAPYTKFTDNNGSPIPIPYSFGGLRQKYLDTVNTPGLLDWSYNPIDELNSSDNKVKLFNARLGGSVKYTIIPGLTAEFRGQYEKGLTNSRSNYNTATYTTRNLINRFMQIDGTGKPVYPIPLGDILDEGNANQTSWNARGQLNLNRRWNDHQIDAIAGVEGRETSYEFNRSRKYGYNPNTYLYATTINYSSTYPNRPNGNYGNNNRISSGDALSGRLNRFISYYANAGYTYQGKYAITASARVDGSNFFGIKANQKLVPLWSSGIGWDISKEEFYSVGWLPYLKLRATYGFNGNMNNSATALPTAFYNLPSGSYHTEPTLSLRTPPNPGLSWERIRMINVGIDFGTLKNRITGSVEYYNKRGIDLIGSLVIESTVGVQNYVANYASMKGKGVDLILNTTNIDRSVKWQTNFILSYNTDEITDYRQTASSATLYLIDNFAVIGKPLIRAYAYPSAGLDPTNGNPRGYVDGNVEDFTKVLTDAQPEDIKYFGTLTPQYFGAVRNNLLFKSISVSANITYRFKYFFRRNTINYNSLVANWGGHLDYEKRWQESGDEQNTTVPSLPPSLDNRFNFYSNSEDLVEKGDHIRLQDVRLSYDFNRATFSRLPFSNAQIYVYANNLGILWRANKSGLDPDFPGLSSIPTPKSWAIGVNVSF